MAEAANIQMWLTGIGLVFITITLIFTGWAAKAAGQAAKAAEKAISVENRPWIQINTPKFLTGLSISRNGGQIQFMVPIKNVGGGPAQKVWVEIGEIDFGTADPVADRDRWIDQQLSRYRGGDVEDEVVFPGQPYEHQAVARFANEIMARHPVTHPAEKSIAPVFIVGAFYRSSADDSIHYTTVGYAVGDAVRLRDAGFIMKSIRMGRQWYADAINSEEPGFMRQPEGLALSRYTGLARAT